MLAPRRASVALAAALALLAGTVAVHAHAPSTGPALASLAEADAAAGEACWLCRAPAKQGGPPTEACADLSLARSAEPVAPVLRVASRHRAPAAARAPPAIDL